VAHTIDSNKCNLCDACRLQCPRNAISAAASDKTYVIDSGLCNDCVNLSTVRCAPHCPVDAIQSK
jgi:ferredoxin